MVTRSSMPPMEEYYKEIEDLWETHWLTNMGEKHEKLEVMLKEYLEVPNISLFTNGHMALELTLQAMQLAGEVITTPFTFISTTHAIVRNGLKPVFCDINPDDCTIDVNKIEALITDKTAAIVPVHVYGQPCDVERIEEIARKYNLKVIYDAAHAFGVKYKGMGIGNFGDASMYSFHATKVFNTIEGGAISYKEEVVGERLYRLRNFGIMDEVTVDAVGANAKMNEFQAAMGICNLRHIEEDIKKRETVFYRYKKHLDNIDGIKLLTQKKDVEYNYSYFPAMFEEEKLGVTREDIEEALKKENIFVRKYFYPLTNSFDCFDEKYCTEDTPVALKVSNEVLTLPMYADLELDNVDRICEIILKVINSKK